MKIDKIYNYLEDNKVKFEEVAHKTVYTAHDVAKTLKMKLGEIGKPLVIKADGKYILVLLPANRQLDIKKLKKQLKAKKVEIISEKVMANALKLKKEAVGCFGKMRQIQTFVDKNILKNKKVILATNDFTKSVKMLAKDFVKLEEAVVGEVSKTKEFKKVKAQAKKKVKKIAKKVEKKIGKKASKSIKKIVKKAPAKKKVAKKKVAKKSTKKKIANNKKIVKKKIINKPKKKKVAKKKAIKKTAKKR